MSKKFHAGLLSVLVCAAIGSLASCTKDYGEDIAQLQSEVSTLQSTVNSLQSQITAGSVITAVNSTSNGVTVTLSNGKTFTLTNGTNGTNGKDGVNGKDGANGTNGKDGVDGKDGKDGIVWTISEDGYWVKDGVKTELKAVATDGKDGANGTNGKDGVNGQDGKDGKDGVDGKDGKDGIYYEPDLENNVWVKVSPDGTKTPTTTSVYVPGTVTAVYDTENGTLTLKNVEGSEEPIVITLAQELKSLAFIPESIFNGLGVIEVLSFQTEEGEFIASSPAKATYRLNPAAVDASAYEWNFINRYVYLSDSDFWSKAEGDSTDLVEIVGAPTIANGAATFTLKLLKNLTDDQERWGLESQQNNYIVALQATTPAGELITSDYAWINKQTIESFEIIHKDTIKFEGEKIVENFPYRDEPIEISAVADSGLYEGVKTPVLKYNETLDLKDYVETQAGQKLASAYGLEPVYTWYWANEEGAAKTPGVKVAYLGDDEYTDQNAFVTLTEDGVMAVDNDFVKNGRAAINRTPLVCVKSTINGTLVDSAFIKVVIVDTTYIETIVPEKPAKGWNILIKHSVPFCYDSLSAEPKVACPDYAEDSLVVTWPEFNQKVLDNDDINMSLAEFRQNYDLAGVKIYEEVVKDAKKKTLDTVEVENNTLATGVDYIWNQPDVETTTTDILREFLINTVEPNSGKKYFYVYPAKDNTENFDVVIEMDYTVNDHVHVWTPETFELTLNHDYILGTQNKTVDTTKVAGAHPEHNTPLAGAVRIKGKSVDGVYEPISSIIEHFENYEFEVPAGSTYTFEIVRAEDKKNFKLVGDGATTDSTAVIAAGKYNAKNDPQVDIKYVAEEALTSTVDVLVKVTETVEACSCTRATYYFVEFGAQFQVELADVVLRTYKAQADSVLVDSLITVTDGTNVVFKAETTEDGIVFKATQYGIDTYGFEDGQLTIESYKIIYDKSGADAEATFGGCLNAVDTDLIVWDNMGTDLQNNKYAKFGVTVQIGTYYKAATEDGKITVLSTENSK